MAENTPAPSPTQAPAPTAAPTPSPAPSPSQASNNEADLRAEAAARRIEAKNERERAEKAERERDEEHENAKRAVEEEGNKFKPIKEKLESRIIQSELKAVAVAAGLKDLDLLPLIKRDAMKLDDDGNPVGIEEAVAAFKESKPDYFEKKSGGSSRSSSEGSSGSGSGSGDPSKKTGSSKTPNPDPDPKPVNVRKLNKEEYAAEKRAALAKIRKAG